MSFVRTEDSFPAAIQRAVMPQLICGKNHNNYSYGLAYYWAWLAAMGLRSNVVKAPSPIRPQGTH
jgi:hypothetical protein